jgi:hypothetical protein
MSEYYAGGGLVPAGTSGTYGAVPSSGTISIQNFYGTSNFVPVYIEEVFSTYLYTGNSSTQTITNGINLSANGGLVWTKARNRAFSHELTDTARGAGNDLFTDYAFGQQPISDVIGFNSSGFNLGYRSAYGNNAGDSYVSWTFRKQPKFFDVMTYTGNGSNRTIAHSLGSVPGCIIVKRTDTTADWQVYHRSNANTEYMVLNSTAAKATGTTRWNSTTPTSTEFSLGTDTTVNASGGTYVAYLFAHNAGGFGLTGTDNVISCGSFTTDGSGNATVNIGYEPQFIIIKPTSRADDWKIFDVMRGWSVITDGAALLIPNNDNAEAFSNLGNPTATGFTFSNAASETSIYIAIRRGPMRTPTTGTSVFEPVAATQGLNTSTPANSSILDDAFISSGRTTATVQFNVGDRLRGSPFFFTQGTNAETSGIYSWARQTGVAFTANLTTSGSLIMYHFRRAPGFFDVVCYTGTGSARTVNHNLGVVPELMIVKGRSFTSSWHIYDATNGATNYMRFNNDPSTALSTIWNNTAPTSTQFTVGTSVGTNSSGQTYVAYLFSTVAGVSKVGSYTGTGALQTVNCGFTGGARFVLIKRTDAGGDWWVYDSARGISSGNDPYLFWNTTDAEVTGTNYVDTTSVGFQVTAAAPAGLNANGGTYIFLAIA